jgi:hypothetical protein
MVQSGKWKNGEGSSGKLINPGKRYFLQLAADCIKAVNNMKDKNGLGWSRKAMIRCGLSLGLNGQWGVNQLSPELQEIIKKYFNEFAGIEEPDSASVEVEILSTDSDAEKLD